MFKIKNGRKGFTLLELLVVVLIIGILTAVALPHYKKVTEKAKMMNAVTTVKAIAQAQKRYYLTHNRYARCEELNALDIDLSSSDNCVYEGNLTCNCRKTSNFLYMSNSGANTALAMAVRTPYPYKYFIRINPNNPDKIICGYTGVLSYNPTQIQKELCDKLNETGNL